MYINVCRIIIYILIQRICRKDDYKLLSRAVNSAELRLTLSPGINFIQLNCRKEIWILNSSCNKMKGTRSAKKPKFPLINRKTAKCSMVFDYQMTNQHFLHALALRKFVLAFNLLGHMHIFIDLRIKSNYELLSIEIQLRPIIRSSTYQNRFLTVQVHVFFILLANFSSFV